MAHLHSHSTTIEIGGSAFNAEIEVELLFNYTRGCKAHYGSLSYAGHPAEPDEAEIEQIKLTIVDPKTKQTKQLDCPDWLRDLIIAGADQDELCESVSGGE